MGVAARGPSEPDARARAEQCDFVVMSLFVNPAQFGPGEDFERYPRDERRDAELAAAAGVDLLFAPPARGGLPGRILHLGRGRRPDGRAVRRARRAAAASHFTGVATVVAKLLNMCAPDVAFFGQKDYPAVARDPPPGARPRHPGAHRGLPDRPRARRPGAQLPQRLPRRRAARARREPEAARSAQPRRRSQDGAAARRSATRRSRVLARRRDRARSTWRCCAPTTSPRRAWQPGERLVVADRRPGRARRG